jgi:hypothetical protein
MNFAADNPSILFGQCTTLRWQVSNANIILLQGIAVVGLNQQYVCPTQTTNYHLQAVTSTGEMLDSYLTVEVR